MSNWTEIYRHKSKEPEFEAWACKGCGAQQNRPHKVGPTNGVCYCEKCIVSVGSDKYRENYDKIFRKEIINDEKINDSIL